MVLESPSSTVSRLQGRRELLTDAMLSAAISAPFMSPVIVHSSSSSSTTAFSSLPPDISSRNSERWLLLFALSSAATFAFRADSTILLSRTKTDLLTPASSISLFLTPFDLTLLTLLHSANAIAALSPPTGSSVTDSPCGSEDAICLATSASASSCDVPNANEIMPPSPPSPFSLLDPASTRGTTNSDAPRGVHSPSSSSRAIIFQ
mmetsp:Transcript_59508/g.81310  ORF Transcript_59508/g.81310 Transcript_59508/m.81310 type:complete len:206 (+) Transcript_59508:213-830(+)